MRIITTRRSKMRTVAITLVICSAGVLFSTLSLQRDYAWLMIALYRLSPPVRTWRCEPFDKRGVPGETLPSDSSSTSLRNRGKPRFAIMVVFDDGMFNLPITQLSIANKRLYALRHNYELLVLHGPEAVDASRPPAWSKFINLQAHLSSYDYICFMDVDTLVTNLAVRLEDLVQTGSGGDLIVSEDWNGVNTGVFLLRNSRWSHWFLEEAWGAKVEGNALELRLLLFKVVTFNLCGVQLQ